MTTRGRLVSAAILAVSMWPRPTTGANNSVVREAFLGMYPTPVSVSPDGQFALTKTKTLTDFSITVTRVGSSKEVAHLRSTDSQLSLTWRPDGKAIVYVASVGGNRRYRVHLWDLVGKRDVLLDIPVSTTAAPPIKWSPDGQYFLYFVGGGAGGMLFKITPALSGACEKIAVGETGADVGFEWSPDGEAVAYIPLAQKNTIAFFGRSPRKKPIVFEAGIQVSDIGWSPDGRFLLATVRGVSDRFFKLKKIDLASGVVTSGPVMNGDVSNPTWLADNRRFLCEFNNDARISIVMGEVGSETTTAISLPDTSNRLLGLSSDSANAIVYAQWAMKPADVVSVPLVEKSKVHVLIGSPAKNRRLNASASLERISSRDGVSIPVIVWRPRQAVIKKAVVWVHGGPHLQERPVWDAGIQALVSQGIAVVVVNYRGSTGYGNMFEKSEDVNAQVLDVIAACDHMASTFGIAASQTALVSSSSGSQIAARAVGIAPEKFGHVIFLSSVPLAPEHCAGLETFKGSVSAFHGQNDTVQSPSAALNNLRACFGPNSDRLASGPSWKIFPNEGHGFQRAGSWIDVYSAIEGVQ